MLSLGASQVHLEATDIDIAWLHTKLGRIGVVDALIFRQLRALLSLHLLIGEAL